MNETEERKLGVYQVETGATYWVAAYDELGAIEVWITASRDEGSVDEAVDEIKEGGVGVEVLTSEEADKISIHDEDRDQPGPVSALVLLNECDKPTLLGCSEW